MLKSLLNFGKTKTLLVCETDGFILRGAVLTRVDNEIVVLHHAQSQQADMTENVAELITSLKSDGWQGGQAVLLSPTVLSTLIELPVDPKKSRPLAQMQELVHWEAEPLLMQHTMQWSIGHLLVGRGYMTEEQVQVVLDLQQGKANAAGGLVMADKFSLRRFGDLAEELGYIRSSQLKACLAAQEWLKSDDEAIECGWSGQAEVNDVPGTFSWLISCVSKSLLQRWTKAFHIHDVTLQAMYPSAGCTATLIPENGLSSIVLESHADVACVMHINDNKIVAHHQYINPANQAIQSCLESYHTINPSPSDPVWFANWDHNNTALLEDLARALDVTVKTLNNLPVSEYLSPGMLGAGSHALGLLGKSRCTDVRLGGPLPALWQRAEVRMIALLLALFLIIAGAELSLLIRDNLIQSHKAEVDAHWKIIDDAVKRIEADIKQVEQRKTLLKEQQSDQLRTEARLSFFGDEIPQREALVQALFGVLQYVVSDEVIINKIDEAGKRVTLMPVMPSPNKDTRVEVENFNLEAWALSEAAAQTFIQQIEQAIRPWEMEVRDSQVVSRLGPFNLDGFTVTMRLVKLVSEDSIKQQQAIP